MDDVSVVKDWVGVVDDLLTTGCETDVTGNLKSEEDITGKIDSTGKTVGNSDESEASDRTGDIDEVTAG